VKRAFSFSTCIDRDSANPARSSRYVSLIREELIEHATSTPGHNAHATP